MPGGDGDPVAATATVSKGAKKELPIARRREEIVQSVRDHRVTIIIAETGSGKSSQVARYIAEADDDPAAKRYYVACTQPRRVAATSLAEFVSKQVDEDKHGKVVASFNTHRNLKKTRNARIVYTTDNSLLHVWGQDKWLRRYSHVVVDEAHERSLATDLILSVMKQTMRDDAGERPVPLSIVITSATIDPVMFQRYFEDFSVNVIHVEGKLYPVRVLYQAASMTLESDHARAAAEKVEEVVMSQPEAEKGGILAFLADAGQAELAQKILERKKSKALERVQIYQLHGRLLLEDQQKVFKHDPAEKRQVIFATNVAETSITVPNITVVIDTGISKEQRFDPVKKVTVLKIGKVNQSSAVQRMGRAGRTTSGTCYRLYAKADFDGFESQKTPEILRVPLEQCMLRLLALGADDPVNFDYVDRPDPEAITRSMDTLMFLGAVQRRGGDAPAGYALTPKLGRLMSCFQLDPRLSKFLILCYERLPNMIYEAVIICAMVANGGHIFYRTGSQENKDEADRKKLRFIEPDSDYMTMLNVFQEWVLMPHEKARRDWCRENFINNKAMNSIQSTARDVLGVFKFFFGADIMPSFGLRNDDVTARLKGLLNECFQQTLAVYSGHPSLGYISLADGSVTRVHAGSSLVHAGCEMPKYIVYNQVMTTHYSSLLHINSVGEDQPFLDGRRAEIENIEEEKTVQPCVVRAAGSRILRRFFVGQKGYKRVALEQEIRELYLEDPSEPLRLEVIADDGTITAWVNIRYHELVKEHLVAAVKEAKDSAGFANFIDSFKNGLAQTEVAIGIGGSVIEPILSGDIIGAAIRNLPISVNLQSLLGEVKSLVNDANVFIKDEEKQSPSLQIFWRLPSAGKRDLQALTSYVRRSIDIDEKDLSVRRKSAKYNSHFTISMELERRKVSRDVKIVFDSGSLAEEFKQKADADGGLLLGTNMCCVLTDEHGGRRRTRYGHVNVANTAVMVTGVSPLVTDDEIAEAVEKVAAPDEFDRDVLLARPTGKNWTQRRNFCIQRRLTEAPYESTPEELAGLREAIEHTVLAWSGVQDNQFDVSLDDAIKDHYKRFRVYINFANVETGISCVRNMQLGLRRVIVGDKHVLSSNARAQVGFGDAKVLAKSEELIKRQAKEVYKKKIGVNFRRMKFNTLVEATAQLENMEYLERFLEDLKKLTTGHVFRAAFVKSLSLPLHWNKIVGPIAKELGVEIRDGGSKLDPHLKIYGDSGQIQKAEEELHSHCSELATSVEEDVAHIGLSGQAVDAADIIKALMNKYGSDLDGLRQAAGVSDVRLQVHDKNVVLVGRQTDIAKATAAVSDLVEHLESSAGSDAAASYRLCLICYTTPKPEEKYVYELCGHVTCKECLAGQVRSGDLPLKCSVEDCGQLLCMHDIKAVFETDPGLQRDLVERSTRNFLERSEDFCNCPVTDCCGIILKKPESPNGQTFACDVCHTNICVSCIKKWHAGKTCDGKDTNDEEFKKWMEEDPANRKKCPNDRCGAFIEKNGGCKHMECTKCGTHICWQCMAKFSSGQDVYAHLGRCRMNNGLIDDEFANLY